MSGPRRRKFVGPIVSRVTWHGGRGTPYLRRWALIIALAKETHADDDAVQERDRGDRRLLARRQLPDGGPDLPARQSAPARAAPAGAHQAAAARTLGHIA